MSLVLTDAQVGRVVTQAGGRDAAMTAGIAASGGRAADLLALGARSHSLSLLRAVLLLRALPPDGATMELAELASQIDSPRSTAHRYLKTWTALGLVEQDPATRRYGRVARDVVA